MKLKRLSSRPTPFLYLLAGLLVGLLSASAWSQEVEPTQEQTLPEQLGFQVPLSLTFSSIQLGKAVALGQGEIDFQPERNPPPLAERFAGKVTWLAFLSDEFRGSRETERELDAITPGLQRLEIQVLKSKIGQLRYAPKLPFHWDHGLYLSDTFWVRYPPFFVLLDAESRIQYYGVADVEYVSEAAIRLAEFDLRQNTQSRHAKARKTILKLMKQNKFSPLTREELSP